jgi:hypothetical protein
MKDPTDPKEKTSRRSFAKTVASALVAVPVGSSLRSHTEPPVRVKPTSQPTVTPLYSSGNPPVIIDGGSLGVSSPATLERKSDNESTPKEYNYKFTERNKTGGLSLGRIVDVLITDDYGNSLLAQHLNDTDTLKVYVWIQKVKDNGQSGDEDDDTDTVAYDPIHDANIPELIIQGGELEIRSDKKLPKVGKLLKRTVRNPKRYERHDWDNRSFRLAQVKAFVNNVEVPGSPFVNADKGFRITLIFP